MENKLVTVKFRKDKGKLIKGSFILHGTTVAKVVELDKSTLKVVGVDRSPALGLTPLLFLTGSYEINRSVAQLLKYHLFDGDNDIGEVAYVNYDDVYSDMTININRFIVKTCRQTVSIGDEVFISGIPLTDLYKYNVEVIQGKVFINGLSVTKGIVRKCTKSAYHVDVCNTMAILKRNSIRLPVDTKAVFYMKKD